MELSERQRALCEHHNFDFSGLSGLSVIVHDFLKQPPDGELPQSNVTKAIRLR